MTLTLTPASTFGPEGLHPYYRRLLESYFAADRPPFSVLGFLAARNALRISAAAARRPESWPGLAGVTNEDIEGSGGPVAIRRYRPHGPLAGRCVYMHSGGWVIGDLDFADAVCHRLAAQSGCEIVSVDYRLAPEHPFPAGLDDAYRVLEWSAGLDDLALFVAGESAGANLAAACAIRARDTGGPGLAGQILAYPVTDHARDSRSYAEIGPLRWLLSGDDMAWFWDQYCPPPVDRNDPLVSPLRIADARGLPDAIVLLAEMDPLRDEGLAYAARLRAADVDVTERLDRGVLHGYLAAASEVENAAAAIADIATFMRQRAD